MDQAILAYLDQSGLLHRESPAASLKFFSPILVAFVAGKRESAPGQLELDEATREPDRANPFCLWTVRGRDIVWPSRMSKRLITVIAGRALRINPPALARQPGGPFLSLGIAA